MRVALAAALLLSGCMLPFCGPTIYHLTGITASTSFEVDAWDVERAAAGAREAGFNVTGTEYGLQAARGETYLGTELGGNRSVRLYTGIPIDGVEGERAEVDRQADEIISHQEKDVREVFAAFARGSAWTLDGPVEWDKGTLHGDC